MHSLQFSGTDAFAVNILSLDANGFVLIRTYFIVDQTTGKKSLS